jgi:hypothetical protein
MEITVRGLWTLVHGMGFGALYLLACSGAMVELWRRYAPGASVAATERDGEFLRAWLIAMAALAWLTVLTGTYIIYPWYRAALPPATTQLAAYPQRLLMSSPATSGWHTVGMEWKEHVAWLTPIAITMAAAVFSMYRRDLRNKPELRAAVLSFVAISFFAAGVAGFFGAMLNKHAPTEGGATIRIMGAERP